MDIDFKLQNEIKIKQDDVNAFDIIYRDLKNTIKTIFESNTDNKIPFDLSKDWTVSLSLKTDPEGITTFTGNLKMIDHNVTGKQLSIFDKFEDKIKIPEITSVPNSMPVADLSNQLPDKFKKPSKDKLKKTN